MDNKDFVCAAFNLFYFIKKSLTEYIIMSHVRYYEGHYLSLCDD